MPANEFEKQVQQQLDEFQLNPSASVWERVEEELRDKRKRRVIYFFLLPGLIVLFGFSVYYFLNSGKKPELASNGITNEKTITTKAQSSTDKINAPVNAKNEKDAIKLNESNRSGRSQRREVQKLGSGQTGPDPNNTIITNRKLNVSYPLTNTHRVNIERPARRTQIVESPAKTGTDQHVPGNDKRTGENNVPVTTIAAPILFAPKADVKNPAATNGKSDKPKENVQANSKDSITKLPDSLAAAVVKTNSDKKSKPRKPSKVKWGIDFFAGASFVQTGMWAWEGMRLGPAAYANNPSSSPGAVVDPRSEVNAGFSFRIGVSGEWKISERSSFSTGLLYDYASNNIKVGSAMDTTLPRMSNSNAVSNSFQSYTIYHGTPTEDHTNSYHYISLPLEYHYLLNKKIKLQWDLGLAVKYLLATNALIYTQSYGGIYYEDKDAFFKTHCTMGTGFSFRIKSKNGMEWVTGPELTFDLTRLLKNEQHKEYLVFTGLRTKVYFPKKKVK